MSRGGFRRQRGTLWQEVSKMSRTLATGRTDTSSSPEKPSVTDVEMAESVRRIDLAISCLDKCSFGEFSRAALVGVNAAIRGVAREEATLRTWDVPRFAYLHVGEVEADLGFFVERLCQLRPPGDATEALKVFFDIHWSVNLRGHYFADACGRTAAVVGCWATYELTGHVLQLPSRAEYLGVASKADPRVEFDRLCRLQNGLG